MAIVYFLRYRRAKYLQARFDLLTRESFSTMSTAQAQAILKDLTELEFPKIFSFSIIFALFKVGIGLLVVSMGYVLINMLIIISTF